MKRSSHRKRDSSFKTRLRAAFSLLFESYAQARAVGEDPGYFALRVTRLLEAGLDKTELLWLAEKGFVDLIIDPISKRGRPFSQQSGAMLSSSASAVLSERAATFAEARALIPVIQIARKSGEMTNSEWRWQCSQKPHWHKKSRELRIGLHVVKHFKQPAPDQELILECFEEEDWPRMIDDPLRMKPGKDPKRRLNDTIKNLKRCQRDPRVRFSASGDGKALGWQIVFSPNPKRP